MAHWEDRRKLLAAAASRGDPHPTAEVSALLHETITSLAPLQARLDVSVAAECQKSSAGRAFVKLSTRSPKDSKKALARAEAAYQARLAALGRDADENERWIILSEEVTKAGSVANGAEALELLLDSDRVYEDLEYALRGPAVAPSSAAAASAAAVPHGGGEVARRWNMELVSRAWDPRLKPASEFRGIAWGGELTCLAQYFHPLYFPELLAHHQRDECQTDSRALMSPDKVQAAVAELGGHCIIDFAWLGPGEVVIIELNPFDGVCLGTFPASTGLFLWDVPADREIMTGKAPFEFRLREEPLDPCALKIQCNQDWRAIVYGSGGSRQGAP